ncbi:MAG: crossover junction endodeoxyribonuclease RuvC [Candidatus Omnitrophota bacterium]|jgi:crossover junction endodeoxyribonuclease RuvC
MRILGVDPALTVTGYGVIDFKKNKFSLLEAGIISTDPGEKTARRLNKIYGAVTKLVSDTEPEVMVLEKLYAHYRHPTTSYILGQARGVICLVSAREGIELVEYAATRVKKAIVGNGLASKYQVQKMVVDMLGLSSLPKYMDVTDALALAIAHSYISKGISYP